MLASPVVRRVLVVLVCLLVAQATDLGSLVAGVACVETCPDDDDAGRCPPTCASCACTSSARADVPRPVPVAAAEGGDDLRPFETDAAPSPPHVLDILHVPLAS